MLTRQVPDAADRQRLDTIRRIRNSADGNVGLHLNMKARDFSKRKDLVQAVYALAAGMLARTGVSPSAPAAPAAPEGSNVAKPDLLRFLGQLG